MTRDEFEVLSALVDGEPVDADELETALALPGARAALVDFARLRCEIQGDRARPAPSFYRRPRRPDPTRRGPWIGVAAAAVLLLAILLPLLGSPPTPSTSPPPRPERVLRFEPGVDWTTD